MSLPTGFVLEPDVVVLDLPARSGDEAVRMLHERLAATTEAVHDAPGFLTGVRERMQMAPVCISEHVALPHARTDAVSRLVLAVGRVEPGIAFDAQHPQVRFVFLIGTPKTAVTEYLRMVAALSRLLRHPATRAALEKAADETEFRAILADGAMARR